MIVLGLTGSIGMGKTTTATLFAEEGIPVYSADEAVHALYHEEPTASLIEAAFPGSVENGAVNRVKLSQQVVGKSDKLKQLEAIVHPLVREKEQKFLKNARERGEKLVVLDIPLLFETGGEIRVDKVAVVSAPFDIQRQRVLARSDMTEIKFEAIVARQMSDQDKRVRADFVINTGDGIEIARTDVKSVIQQLLAGKHAGKSANA